MSARVRHRRGNLLPAGVTIPFGVAAFRLANYPAALSQTTARPSVS
jgi:hypothetical protein